MCTLTILREGAHLTLTMNRDDAPGRPEAPPRLWGEGEAAFAAPVDLDAGGAWIAVNRAGVIACLLNRYDPAEKGVRTRGEIVLRAMSGVNIHKACAAVETLDHKHYSPFTCLIVSAKSANRIDWDGVCCTNAPLHPQRSWMLTSSSWRLPEVRARREALFDVVMNEPNDAALSDFHCKLRPGDERWAPMMQRENAHTKSVTQVRVAGNAIEMKYWTRERALARGLSAPGHIVRLSAHQQMSAAVALASER